MIGANKSIACLLLMFILTVSVCVCADSRKAASQEQPKYELKSDIINFDYTQLAYPFDEAGIGIKTDTSRVPKKITARVQEAEYISPLTVLFDACCLAGKVIVLTSCCFAAVTYFPAILVKVFILIRGSIIRYKKVKKKVKKDISKN